MYFEEEIAKQYNHLLVHLFVVFTLVLSIRIKPTLMLMHITTYKTEQAFFSLC